MDDSLENSFVLFSLAGQEYGIRTEHVSEMVILGNVVPMPQQSDHLRGVLNLRGRTIPVVDMRKLFGLPGINDQVDGVQKILNERKQDHINWLNNLKTAVDKGEHFQGELDPTKCGFGKWYYSFKTDNPLLRMQLNRFEEPHKQIHAIAHDVQDLIDEGDKAAALEVIQKAWDEKLSDLIELFDETRDQVISNTREIVLVTRHKEEWVGLIVDRVLEVRDIMSDQIEEPGFATRHAGRQFLEGLARVDEEVKLLVDYEQLVTGEGLDEAVAGAGAALNS